jgi:hypothetical protein
VIVNAVELTRDLRAQLAELASDLRSRIQEPGRDSMLRDRWRGVRQTTPAAPAFEVWKEDRITHGAAAWLLSTLFLRFCEDNELISAPYLAGPNGRLALACDREVRFLSGAPELSALDWLREGLQQLKALQVLSGLLDPDGDLSGVLEISPEAAARLTDFWRRTQQENLVHDFTDPRQNTDFLGAVYQDLSDEQRSRYALLETPGFIADLLLDETLQPAIAEFGPEHLRCLDPVCGSGTFLLAMFRRLDEHWSNRDPSMPRQERVARILRAVHGVDRSPVAAAIARFRLLVAAVAACGANRLADLPPLEIVVASADALLSGRGAPRPDMGLLADDEASADFGGDDVRFSAIDLLGADSYHVVVGNPPYLTPKDKAEADTYRAVYPYLTGAYALTVPFIIRFFQLGTNDAAGSAGYIGLLVSNSFMKREFGRHLVEDFLPTVDVTHVIDTSGMFIPGHGTPTAVLIGRSRSPEKRSVTAVISLRGEPEVPADPSQGIVLRSIRRGLAAFPYEDEWVQVADIERSVLGAFPLNLAGVGVTEILRLMRRGGRLGERVVRIGYFANTGADDIFTAPPASFRRVRAESAPLIPVITGSEIRDWQAQVRLDGALFPETDGAAGYLENFPRHRRRLWPYRTVLELRRNYSGRSYLEDGRRWYDWHQIADEPDAHPWRLVFPWVSTHNHFAVLRDRAAPLNSAPVIWLPRTASDSDVTQLAALLNSSLACFWLKQQSNSKGQPRADQTGTGERWTLFYEFTGSRVADFPLPPDRWSGDRWSVHAEELDGLAQELASSAPRMVLKSSASSYLLAPDAARFQWESACAQMVSLQEELDWEIYERYGLVERADRLTVSSGDVPGIRPGERAFEILLARDMASGKAETTWFSRHHIAPVISLPDCWPVDYRKVVENRISAIRGHPDVGIVERPEFKRRWVTASWDDQEEEAVRELILDWFDRRDLWYEDSGEIIRPRVLTSQELSEIFAADIILSALAARIWPAEASFEAVISGLLHDECVPYTAPLLYNSTGLEKRSSWEEIWKLQRITAETGRRPDIPTPPKFVALDYLKPSYWRWRGKYDVRNERFISFPCVRGGQTLFGWAGWEPGERAAVLMDLLDEAGLDADMRETALPLLVGLHEQTFWLGQEESGDRARAYLERAGAALGVSESDLLRWRPPKPKRGRPRKKPVN